MADSLETRTVQAEVEVREDGDSATIVGHAATFNQPYRVGYFTERLASDAFKRTLANNPDVRLLINHDGVPIGRTKSGTLTLDTDDRGLTVSAPLDMANPRVQEVTSALKRGDIDQMSFAFRVPSGGDTWDYSGDSPLRTVREASLSGGDVSIVTYPANENASVALRAAEARSANMTLIDAMLTELHAGRAINQRHLRAALADLGIRTVGDSFNDTESALRDALQQHFGGSDGDEPFDLWVQDAGTSWVVFQSYGDAGPGKGMWRMNYAASNGSITLSGDPEQVTTETSYLPVQTNSAPAVAGIPSDLAARIAEAASLRRKA